MDFPLTTSEIKKNNKLNLINFQQLNDEGIINACTGKWIFDEKNNKKLFSFSKKQPRDIYLQNLKSLCNNLHIKPDIVAACEQVHGKDAAIVDPKALNPNDNIRIYSATDALITHRNNVMLLITTADCVPIFVYEPKRKIIANIHAGWRGTHQNILSSTLDLMENEFGVAPKDCFAFLGPAIGQCCFEVGNHVAGLFKNDYGRQYLEFNNDSGKNNVDLKAVNIDIALSKGIKRQNIISCDICTCCDENFFSYRRDGLIGLSANIIMLTK
jgi:YfiH family protein